MPAKKQLPGSVIIRKRFHRSKGYEHSDVSRLHTLDPDDTRPGLVSVVDRSDLDEMMHAAELADRDFTAERGMAQVVLDREVSTAYANLNTKEKEALQQAEEELHRANLKIPRRPPWTPSMTAEELDDQERKSFLEWRRGLASLEENEKLVLTPFEKNLDIWRQLWRVLERSEVIVTILDSRNPLFYRCADLEAYVKELNPNKRTILLLNKADLLPPSARLKWYNYFTNNNISFYFWSAKEASEEVTEEEVSLKERETTGDIDLDEKVRVLTRDELLDKLYEEARLALDSENAIIESSNQTEGKNSRKSNVTVGFVGYPNVGKSSSINALVGLKKTGVTATPGKTKHFQTLILREDFVLCDCPGLVFPSFASSKSEMVAGGVLPIDRLTDQRGPVEVVAKRVPRSVIEKTYNIVLPKPASHEDPNRPPTAAEVLKAYAGSRGYVAANGLPDETRASRQMLKDYLSGKLLDYQLPPGESDDDRMVDNNGVHEPVEDGEQRMDGTIEPEVAKADDFEDLGLDDVGTKTKLQKQPTRAAHKLQKKSVRKKDRSWRAT